jgi:uncharacterized protein DUF222
MFDQDVSELDAGDTLRHVAEMRALSERADCSILAAAAHWADLHGVVDDGTLLPGTERLVRLGGDGTPEVAEFASAELGAELGMSPYAASLLIADALDLRHRLPVLWTRIVAGEVKPWIGRKVAQTTRGLSAGAVVSVDTTAARWADRLTWGRLSAVIDAAVIAADPAAAEAASEGASGDCGVWVSQSNDHGTKTVFIRAEAPDVIWFDATIDRIADGIGLLGDGSGKDNRRARAVGILADPQQALDLFQRAADASCPGSAEVMADTSDTDRHTGVPRRINVDSRPPATLYVHVSREVFDADADSKGVARLEGGVGPVTVEQARRWLAHCRVTVKPVIDLAALAPVDGYEIPDRLREAVHLLSPADIFPFASNTTRTHDIDHTVAYSTSSGDTQAGGTSPPAQTGIGNLAPLTRFHHRIKTHGRWRVMQPYPGVFVWRSPHGRIYLVDHTGTRKLPGAA